LLPDYEKALEELKDNYEKEKPPKLEWKMKYNK
jgi:hypothetical protein